MQNTVEEIDGRYYFVEIQTGDSFIQKQLCDVLGHDVKDQDHVGETFVIQKGICIRCGQGKRYWELSDKQVAKYHRQCNSYR